MQPNNPSHYSVIHSDLHCSLKISVTDSVSECQTYSQFIFLLDDIQLECHHTRSRDIPQESVFLAMPREKCLRNPTRRPPRRLRKCCVRVVSLMKREDA